MYHYLLITDMTAERTEIELLDQLWPERTVVLHLIGSRTLDGDTGVTLEAVDTDDGAGKAHARFAMDRQSALDLGDYVRRNAGAHATATRRLGAEGALTVSYSRLGFQLEQGDNKIWLAPASGESTTLLSHALRTVCLTP